MLGVTPVAAVIVVTGLACFGVEHGRVFPAGQLHDYPCGLPAEQLGRTLSGWLQLETLTRGTDGRFPTRKVRPPPSLLQDGLLFLAVTIGRVLI